MALTRRPAAMIAASTGLALALLASAASAQTMLGSGSGFNAGYGRTAGSENAPVDVQLTSAQGNLVVVNGQFQGTASGSVFASGGGAEASASGAGASASAIGNNLTVITQGNNNTVIVSATQTNTGQVTAISNSGK